MVASRAQRGGPQDFVMTPEEFRQIALDLPGAVEGAHGGHPDFRVGGKVFASLGWPDRDRGMVKLTPEEQELFVHRQPAAFAPVPGAWGRRGSTLVRLAAVDADTLHGAMTAAWRKTAPKRLADRTPSGGLRDEQRPERRPRPSRG
jgi:hypothetical protein